MEVPASLQIRRKPITTSGFPAPPSPTPSDDAPPPYTAYPSFPVPAAREFAEKPPPLPARPNFGDGLRADVQIPARPVSRGEERLLQVPQGHRLRMQTSLPNLSRFANPPSPSSPSPSSPQAGTPPIGPAATFGPSISDNKKSFMQNALSEARHFAGGLVPHPTESTKHYTILRHSPPLIFYRGPSTSVAITIFSSPDHPLPADRTLWLQQRGFSGDSGMKIKAFFNATDSWLHVTPSTQVPTHQLEPDTERAWQRDIAKAAKKLLKEKGPKKAHIARETHVVRIPEASEDGYFRLILCTGGGSPYDTESSSKRKTLCTSPIFRVASTSADASSFRGASLSTLPLEVGVFAASMVASATVDKYTAPVRAPVEAVVNKVRPGFITETIGAIVRDELSDRNSERDAERDQAFYAAHQTHVVRSLEADPEAIHPVGPDSGPEAPFPLKFEGKVIRGTGRSQAELGIPTANLANVPDEIKHRLNGIYFGWTRVLPPQDKTKTKSTNIDPTQPEPPWHEAIITIHPDPLAPPSVTPTPLVSIHLLSHLPSPTPSLLSTTLQTIIMGLLRPAPSPLSPPLTLQTRMDDASRDACRALVSLARENWLPEVAVERLRRESQQRGLGEKLEGVVKEKVAGKMRMPSVPLHLVGVRSGAGEERDRVLGAGGFWVGR